MVGDLISFNDPEDQIEELGSSAFDFGLDFYKSVQSIWKPTEDDDEIIKFGNTVCHDNSDTCFKRTRYNSVGQESTSPVQFIEPGRLHVSNIPFKYRREHLQELFSRFGKVCDAEIIFNERGSKGFGFVSFDDKDSANKAKMLLNGIVIEGRKIEVNIATPKPPIKQMNFRTKKMHKSL